MHFYYLDEAGCTGSDLASVQQPIFVLGGVSVRDEGWNKTKDDMQSIVSGYFGGNIPAGFEIHAEELLSPNGGGVFRGHDRDKRNALAKELLSLIPERKHHVHFFAIEKNKMSAEACGTVLGYDMKTPYLVAFDYLVTYINWVVKEKLGQSARGMIILDVKDQFNAEVERIVHERRYGGAATHRAKWLAEFSYPIDSRKNPMVQLSDLVCFCVKKFFELDRGYRDAWTNEAKLFFGECFDVINQRVHRKNIVERNGRGMAALNNYLEAVQVLPSRTWKAKCGL